MEADPYVIDTNVGFPTKNNPCIGKKSILPSSTKIPPPFSPGEASNFPLNYFPNLARIIGFIPPASRIFMA